MIEKQYADSDRNRLIKFLQKSGVKYYKEDVVMGGFQIEFFESQPKEIVHSQQKVSRPKGWVPDYVEEIMGSDYVPESRSIDDE